MAFYSPNFYKADLGEYNLTPFDDGYNNAPNQAVMPYSDYEFNEPNYMDYEANSNYGAYDRALNRSVIAYSTTFFSQPKVIEYDPTYYLDGDYNQSRTQYIVSYSTVSALDFNEDVDVDYDPTPYDGGYDPALTYGKPLSPSDEICYPHSTLDSRAPPMEDGVSNIGVLALPYGEEEADEHAQKPQNGNEPTLAKEVEQEPRSSNGDLVNKGLENGHESHLGEERALTADQIEDEEEEEEEEAIFSDEPCPLSGYDYGFGNGRSEEYGYECDRQVPQTPCGYGSDVMNLWESIFGHWPCLPQKDHKIHGCEQVADHQEGNWNQWNGTADYLFGSSSSYTYSDQRVEGGIYENPIFGYERHYQEPLQHMQIEYGEYSWL